MCSVEGCDKKVVSHGLCDMHRIRMKKHGSTDNPRSSRWGEKEKHPLYDSWYSLKRKNMLEDIWLDMWRFVSDLGNKPNNHKLSRKEDSQLYGPDNWLWVEINLNKKDYSDAAAYQRAYRKINPDSFRNSELKKKYGITLQEYNSMLKQQNGVCAICGEHETTVIKGKVMSLSVDHCHTTNKVRGLLCNHCNHAIGKLKDDVALLEKAIAYLKKQ